MRLAHLTASCPRGRRPGCFSLAAGCAGRRSFERHQSPRSFAIGLWPPCAYWPSPFAPSVPRRSLVPGVWLRMRNSSGMVRGAPCSVVEKGLRVFSVSATTFSLGGTRCGSIARHLRSCGRLLGWFSLAAGCAYRRSAGAAEFALPACGVWGAGGCCVAVAVLMLTCPTTAAANRFKGVER